jgi:hypothetical protein
MVFEGTDFKDQLDQRFWGAGQEAVGKVQKWRFQQFRIELYQ